MRTQHSYFPKEMLAMVRTPESYFSDRLYKIALVGGTFMCAHYVQQLDISRLTIQKHMIRK